MQIDIKIPGFELMEEIGAGGMAKVYLGMQTLLERKVAIKVLHQRLSAESDEFKQRFFYEGKVLAKLQHPNIVSIIDIGEANGLLYMIMEYVEGGTLADWLKVQQLTVEQAIQICTKVGLALHATHLKHIVHRDLKPSNILLRDIYTPLLTDFGIARQTDVDQGLTQTGHIVGTMQYMSPEQIRGQHIDLRSDIYSLGLMFYRLLVGKLPFISTSQYDLSRMQCEDPPPPLPDYLSGLQRVMDSMLAKDREERFPTCLDFCKAVQNIPAISGDYANELTQQTRIFDSSQFQSSGSRSGQHSFQSSGQFATRVSGEQSNRFSSRDSAQGSGQESTRILPRGSGPHSQQSQGYGAAGGEKLKKILKFGLPALAVVIATVLYFAIWYTPSSGLSEDEQRRVDRYLDDVQGYIFTRNFEEPEGKNAIYALQNALKMAPKYEPALEYGRQIAEYFEFKAMDLQDAGQLEAAKAEILKGLEISPGYENLVKLDTVISSALAEKQRQAELIAALAKAASYVQLGQLTEPENDNAYSAYRRIVELDPGNTEATTGLKAILKHLLDEAQSSFDNGNLDLAENQVIKAASFFPNESGVTQLQTSINDRRVALREQQEIADYLVKAQYWLEVGNLIEPAQDNALDNFTEVLNRNPDNATAIAGLETIASRFSAQAAEALNRNEFSEALKLADSGLLAVPNHERLLDIQRQSTSQLGAREREIQSNLQQAQRLILSGNYLPPGDNALDLFKTVEQLDPGNEQARMGIARLPDQVYEEAQLLEKRGNLSGANELLTIARSTYPREARFAELQTTILTQIESLAKGERLKSMLSQAANLIAMRPMTQERLDQAAKALDDLNREFPGNLATTSQLADLVNAVNEEATGISRGGNEDAGIVLVDRALSHFEGNRQLLSARTVLEKSKSDRLAEEARRLAALMGQLVIDAVPWGEVAEIKDASGKTQPLPTDNSTPLLVSLMAGKYTVSVRSSDNGAPQELAVNVVAQDVRTAVAKFDSMTADEYFERANW